MGTVLIGFIGRALWSAYAVRAQDLALFIGQGPVAIGFAAIGFFVARDRRNARTSVLLWSGLAASLIASLLLAIWAPLVLTTIAIVFAAAVSLPQMIETLRRGESLAGVSEWMYWFTSAASATWFSYGLIVDFAISLPHFVVLPTSLITAVVVHRRNRRTPGSADGHRDS